MARRLLAALCLCALAASAAAERWWIFLPPARTTQSLAGFAAAPSPNERALARTALRGDAQRAAALRRGPERAALLRWQAELGAPLRVSRWLCAASFELTPQQLASLRARKDAPPMRPVRRLRAQPLPELGPALRGAPAKTLGPHDYGPSGAQMAMIEIDRLHALGLDGHGVRILVLDTGFALSSPALAGVEVVASWDFLFDDPIVANEAEDHVSQHGHGSGVLALLAGYDPGQLVAPAFAAELLLAKTEDVLSETQLEEDRFVAALEWGEALGADLCTASLGYRDFDDLGAYPPEAFDGDTALSTRAFDALAALGVVALCAAGNRGADGPQSLLVPADADSALAIGSVRADSLRSNFSSRGPSFDGRIKPDLVALGTESVWALPNGSYGSANGTSTATPQAAGAAALLLQAHPEWTAMQVVEALRQSATQAQAPDDELGYGLVRAHAANFDFGAPIHPLPFALLEPPADVQVAADGGAAFRWRRARDLQSPQALQYVIEFAAAADFATILHSVPAGADSALGIGTLSAQSTHWRVRAIDPEGHARASRARALQVVATTAVDSARSWVWLRAPRPNPFRHELSVPIEFARAARFEMELFDLRGRRLRHWPMRPVAPGLIAPSWDGRDAAGDRVAAGVYWIHVRAETATERRQLARRVLRLP